MPPSAHRAHDCPCTRTRAAEVREPELIPATAARRDTRRNFLKKSAIAVIAGLVGTRRATAQSSAPSAGLGAWARLATPYWQWRRHQEEDAKLTDFIRKAGVKISPDCYTVAPSSLADLCAFPFVFCNHLAAVSDASQLNNLREYLYRGGFIYVDGCDDYTINPSFRVFHEQHIALFARWLPGSQVRLLPSQHPIFRSIFSVAESSVISKAGPHDPKWAGASQALYGIFDDDRMIILLSQLHLRCAWGFDADNTELKMRQAANIYAYAMTP